MFEVGDRVRCVDDRWPWWYDQPIKRGQIYTISRIAIATGGFDFDGKKYDGKLLVDLSEAPCPQPKYDRSEYLYEAWRFRKLRDISQSMAEFRQMTINTPKELIRG